MTDQREKLGTCAKTYLHHADLSAHHRAHTELANCTAWREQPAQAEPHVCKPSCYNPCIILEDQRDAEERKRKAAGPVEGMSAEQWNTLYGLEFVSHTQAGIASSLYATIKNELTRLREERDALKFRLYYYPNHKGTAHQTSCSIWREDGQGHAEGFEGDRGPCNCGCLENFERQRAERAESALAEAQELLGVMYGWAKYGEESDHWYYSEEQAPGWKADSERASKLLGFKLKAKP